MKKILVGFILFLLVGCVANEPIDYSLTNTEKAFLRNIFSPQYPIDSVEIEVRRWFFWTKDRGKYDYFLATYTSIPKDSIDPKIFQSKMDSLANFIADFTKKANMPLSHFSLFYEFKRGISIVFSYDIDRKNRPCLINSSF